MMQKTESVNVTEEATFAAGCFWGVEYYFKRLPGVLKTKVGYTGGKVDHPSYAAVCSKNTGHYEAIHLIYDPKQISYRKLVQFFFEIHDFTQKNGQGPDIGEQYLSVIFYNNETQKNIAEEVIETLKNQHFQVSTKLLPACPFWLAEEYHQDYYAKTHKMPYCHTYIKRF